MKTARILGCVQGVKIAIALVMFALATLFAQRANASPPSWWVLLSATNDYAAVNKGQLKWFTEQAVSQMNASLPMGSGTALNPMVSGWISQYQSLGYSGTNPMPSDFNAVNVGQLKYIGNLVWKQLQLSDYVTSLPSWIVVNSAVDNHAANIGQLKTVFNFDLTSTDSTHDTNGDGLPDWWENYYFGTLNVNPATIDASDGLTYMVDYLQGRTPNKGYAPDSGGVVALQVFTPLQ